MTEALAPGCQAAGKPRFSRAISVSRDVLAHSSRGAGSPLAQVSARCPSSADSFSQALTHTHHFSQLTKLTE